MRVGITKKKFFFFGFLKFLACGYHLRRGGLAPQWWQPSLGIKTNDIYIIHTEYCREALIIVMVF